MLKIKAMQLVAEPLVKGTWKACDLIVIGIFEGGLKEAIKHEALAPHGAMLNVLAQQEQFVGHSGQKLAHVVALSAGATGKARGTATRRIVLLGMGKKRPLAAAKWLAFGGTVTRIAHGCGSKTALVVPPVPPTGDALTPLAQGAVLGTYRYDSYKGPKAQEKLAAQAPRQALGKIIVEAQGGAEAAHALQVGQVLATATAVARDLVNCPPNDLYPESFAAKAQKLARQFGVGIKVLGPKELTKLGMGMLMGVGAGSERLPRLVHLSYAGKAQKKAAPTLLVGKGITFDSGGLCLKTCDGMGTMKMDMGGAAAVLATVLGAAALKLDVHVQGVLALAENMPSGHALRPGDVLRSAAGLTVEVNNTDAEGRLVLGDALHFGITRSRPAKVIDVATLTGACMVALGPHTSGLFCNNDALAQSLLTAAEQGAEHMWRLPLTEALADQLRSDVADLRNTGDRYGGAITAALFLQRFVGETPWAHLDIAGPAWASSESSTRRKGGTGAAVASLLHLLLADHRGAQGGGGTRGGRRTRGQ